MGNNFLNLFGGGSKNSSSEIEATDLISKIDKIKKTLFP